MTDARRHLSPWARQAALLAAWARQPDARIAALAEALRDVLEDELCTASQGVLHDIPDEWWTNHAAAILAALDGWTLVPEGHAWKSDREAEVLRLRMERDKAVAAERARIAKAAEVAEGQSLTRDAVRYAPEASKWVPLPAVLALAQPEDEL